MKKIIIFVLSFFLAVPLTACSKSSPVQVEEVKPELEIESVEVVSEEELGKREAEESKSQEEQLREFTDDLTYSALVKIVSYTYKQFYLDKTSYDELIEDPFTDDYMMAAFKDYANGTNTLEEFVSKNAASINSSHAEALDFIIKSTTDQYVRESEDFYGTSGEPEDFVNFLPTKLSDPIAYLKDLRDYVNPLTSKKEE